MSTYEINYCIVRQLPWRFRELLVTINYSDTFLVTQVIAQLNAYETRDEIGQHPTRGSQRSFTQGNRFNGGDGMQSDRHQGISNRSYQRGRDHYSSQGGYRPSNREFVPRVNQITRQTVSYLPDVSVPPPDVRPEQSNDSIQRYDLPQEVPAQGAIGEQRDLN